MRNLLRCQASLRQKLLRLTSCRLSFLRFHEIGTGYSGPPPTEPYIGDYQPLFTGKKKPPAEQVIPGEVDVAIIGGGLVGLCTAFFIKHKFPRSFTMAVIEKDPLSSSAMSVCGIRHQYSLPEHVKMSLFASEFLCDIEDYLTLKDVEPPDVLFNPQGYLLLSSKDEVELMENDHKTQLDAGANVELMSRTALQKKFPWLSSDDLELASYGLEKEGWFDASLLIAALKAKLASVNVCLLNGNVVGFNWKTHRIWSTAGKMQDRSQLTHVHMQTADGCVYPIKFGICLNSTGAEAQEIARLAGIGMGEDALSFDLPIMSRNRFIYTLHCTSGPGLNMPMLLDVSGFFLRREGLYGNYICSTIPPLTLSGQNDDSLDPAKYFTDVIKPLIVQRIPSMEQLELMQCWKLPMQYNYFDRCPIVGNHPYHRNYLISAGSVGHGAQFAPAIGRALMQFIVYGDYRDINLDLLTFDRVLDDEPISERLVM